MKINPFITILILSAFLFLNTSAFAEGDQIKLKDGTLYKGSIVAQTDDQYYFNDGKEVLKINFSDIESITFGPKLPSQPTETKPENELKRMLRTGQ